MMNKVGLMVRTCVATALALVFMGCSKGNSSAPQVNALGQHPADWLATHWISFNQNKNQCAPCHGSFTSASSTGGTTGINCFTCHAQQTPAVYAPTHPAGWQTVGNVPFHGTYAKQAASLTGGFAHCSACHGTNYDNADGTTESCMTCHTNAPHPDKPWHGTTADGTNHATTDPSNAAECAKCHLNGANLDPNDLQFHGTAAAGTAPGCFNNTLCHGNNPGHIYDWALPTLHGQAAMTTPSSTAGFAYCATCHGASYAGAAGTSCLACHTNAPHPDSPWYAPGTLISHDLTNPGNAGQCVLCHALGNNSTLKPSPAAAAGTAPGCFNGTMCHSVTGI
jgi:hypothetical protein